jgi:signal transduction histidine kinase
VVDQGPGMDESERRHAFDRFWQGPGRRGGHSGLGLAIVRQLAVRNHLVVELRPAPDGGLDAVVTLSATADLSLRGITATP